MKVVLNGKETLLNKETTLQELVKSMGLENKSVAVELNGSVVRKDKYSSIKIKEGDKMEVVTFVGGG